jgi:hypothetical protein
MVFVSAERKDIVKIIPCSEKALLSQQKMEYRTRYAPIPISEGVNSIEAMEEFDDCCSLFAIIW